MSSTDVTAVRDAFAALARSFKRISVYRHARDQHAAYLEPAAAELRSLLEQKPAITVTVEPTALVYEGEPVHSEPARETGFCFRLHRDGVRALSFRRGLGVEELLALANVALADPQQEGGREDAVTELWKADLSHVGYSAIAGYRMDEAAGDNIAGTVSEIAGSAQDVLDRHVGESFMEAAPPGLLWTDEQRQKRDPADWKTLARRAAMTILRIVELDYAGWDLEALEESFWRLADQMLSRSEPQALAQSLDRARRISGSHAAEFRNAVGRKLADPARIENMMRVALGSEKPPLVQAWTQLLPPDAGPALFAALPLARDAAARLHIATAILSRIESCAPQLDELLRRGSPAEVSALLSALSSLPPAKRGNVAVAALANPDKTVLLETIPLLAADAALAASHLGPALASQVRAVRVAAVQALATCAAQVEPASNLILAAVAQPQFAGVDKEERTLFYRSLGKLGSPAGLSYLLDRLARPAKKFFGRRKAVEEQLLAVQGLVEDAGPRSLRALEDVLLPARGHAPAVVAACRSAAQHLRAALKGGKTA
jgi:hypothetical protein